MLLQASFALAAPSSNGLYATFKTTEGDFVIDLAFEQAPITVANFVGLAEGSRGWVDFDTGRTSFEPFYDGRKIPRAEPGFVIQMGSPLDTTAGGPGYQIPDEFHPDQRHDSAGTLSMANSGSAGTGGSQIFITLDATLFLDFKHSVFGKVTEGLDVVQAIGQLPGGSVTIKRVIISRIGSAAKAFDVNAWGLPTAARTQVEFDTSDAPTTYLLKFPRKTFTTYYTFDSPNLNTPGTWLFDTIDAVLDTAPQEDLDVTARAAGDDEHFFSVAEIEYVPVPESINGFTTELTLVSSNPDQFLSMTFTEDPRASIDYSSPLGTYLLTSSASAPREGTIGAYTWTQSLNRGTLTVTLQSLGTYTFYNHFRPDGSGAFIAHGSSGSAAGPFTLHGTFTSGPSE